MTTRKGPKGPSRPTVKRIFAVSGNCCAFPKCSTPLVDPQSGSIVGEVCHIRGEKPGAARYDGDQSDMKRHGFDNLLLLCNVHHKIVDDDEVAYTIKRLVQMKKGHEAKHASPPFVDKATAERFISVAVTNSTVHGSVVASHGQVGGQTAHVIHNYQGVPPADEPVRLEGTLTVAVEHRLMRVTGCPGIRSAWRPTPLTATLRAAGSPRPEKSAMDSPARDQPSIGWVLSSGLVSGRITAAQSAQPELTRHLATG